MNSLLNKVTEQEPNVQKDFDAQEFLKAQKLYISEIKLFPLTESPSDETDNFGWEDDSYYYLPYSNTWKWIRAYFIRNGIKLLTAEKDLDHYMVEAGIFESNEKRPKSRLMRADRRTPPLRKRVFMINKARFDEFLAQK
ncbi:hypothetical protein BK140_03820 [Paenibacillus macerans]|nr:hypothetical protein BK140_03820 [Paenibacillus macerans]